MESKQVWLNEEEWEELEQKKEFDLEWFDDGSLRVMCGNYPDWFYTEVSSVEEAKKVISVRQKEESRGEYAKSYLIELEECELREYQGSFLYTWKEWRTLGKTLGKILEDIDHDSSKQVWRDDREIKLHNIQRYDKGEWFAATADIIKEEQGFLLRMGHMFSIKGKGFLAVVSPTDGSFPRVSGCIEEGTDHEAYNHALLEGTGLLYKAIKDSGGNVEGIEKGHTFEDTLAEVARVSLSHNEEYVYLKDVECDLDNRLEEVRRKIKQIEDNV